MNLALAGNRKICPSLSAYQIFQLLEGNWQLQRILGSQATMQGTASFQKIPGSCAYYYQEAGSVQFQKKCLKAHRAYVYAYQNDNIAVYFWDPINKQPGNLLHWIQFSPAIESCWPTHGYGIHICNQDIYQAHYRFYNHTNFQLLYTVDGPCKHYTLKSYFSRVLPN
jgi:hypothetical protein